MSSNSNATSSSNINKINDNEASFETSFADDVNGAAFKSLLKNTTSNSTNANATMTSTDDQQVNLNSIQFDSTAAKGKTGNNNGDPQDEDDQQQPPEDLNLFISDLLEQMQSKFENMGTTILGRIDDMGSRIDTLEKSIGDLMDQSGLSESEPLHGGSSDIIKKNDKSDDL